VPYKEDLPLSPRLADSPIRNLKATKSNRKVIAKAKLSREAKCNLDLEKITKVFKTYNVNTCDPRNEREYFRTQVCINKIKSICEELHYVTGSDWTGLNKLFETQESINSLLGEFLNNARLKNYLERLREVVKFKLDQKWVAKTGKHLEK
jgi:hypothetical protein